MKQVDQKEPFYFSTGTIAYPFLFVLLIWTIYWIELRFNISFNSWGVYPQTLKGARGIIFSPFIHSGVEHLYHNTIPLFLLSMGLFYFYRPIAWKVLLFGILFSGFLTWLIGRPSNHIGASGLIYVLVSFIFFKGIRTKYFRLIALSLIVVFIYGSMVWYVFPIKEGMSWEGHLAGLVTGLLFAFIFKSPITNTENYEWEKEGYEEDNDPFLKHFDEDGNFVPASEMEKEEDDIKIIYDYKEKKKK